jgi:hypothetical protein
MNKLKIVLMVDQTISSQTLSDYLLKNQDADFEIIGIIRQYFAKRKETQRLIMSRAEKFKELFSDKNILKLIWFLGIKRWFVSPKSIFRKMFIKILPKRLIRYYSIEELAGNFNVPLLKTDDINNDDTKNFLIRLKPDLGIVCGTGIVKDFIFNIPKFGCINYHNGLLPKYRGCAAVFWQLYYNDSVGYTIHKIDSGIDTGNIIKVKTIDFKRGNDLWKTIVEIKKIMSIDCAKEIIRIIKELRGLGKIIFYFQNENSASFFKFPTQEQKEELENRFSQIKSSGKNKTIER